MVPHLTYISHLLPWRHGDSLTSWHFLWNKNKLELESGVGSGHCSEEPNHHSTCSSWVAPELQISDPQCRKRSLSLSDSRMCKCSKNCCSSLAEAAGYSCGSILTFCPLLISQTSQQQGQVCYLILAVMGNTIQQRGGFFPFPYTGKRKRGMISEVGLLPSTRQELPPFSLWGPCPRKGFTHPWGKAVSGSGVVTASPLCWSCWLCCAYRKPTPTPWLLKGTLAGGWSNSRKACCSNFSSVMEF